MKTTIEINDYMDDDKLKAMVLKQLGIQSIYDMDSSGGKITIDWDLELVKKDYSHSPSFDGYTSYAYLDIHVGGEGLVQISVQYFIDDNDSGDFITVEFKVTVENGGVEDKIQHDVIQPTDVVVDFDQMSAIVTF